MNAPGTTSTNWLRTLREHDQAAWDQLADLYGPLVYALARGSGLDKADAQDVSQEVFRKVFLGLPEFRRDRPGDSFRGWIRTIARNAILDHLRHMRRIPHAVGGSDSRRRWLELAEPDRVSADASSTDLARGDVLRRAVELFGKKQHKTAWRAFWRTEIEGAAPEEVAAELGVSVWAIYKGRTRVLRELRERFGELLD